MPTTNVHSRGTGPDANDAGTVGTLVPGLPFSATVDTKTAAGRTAVVNSAR